MSITKHDEQQTISAPALGDAGEPCADCGAPLARDQRYCLNCGRRRAGTRLPFMDVIQARIRRGESGVAAGTASMSSSSLPQQPPLHRQPLLIAAGVGLFALVLGLGVLIGSLGGDDSKPVAAAPPVVNVTAPASGATTATAEFTSDWPDGTNGYTIQLDTLAKDSADPAKVASAKQDAEASGASDVGALDSDDFSSLDGGNYVIYSGVFDSKKQANRELKNVKKDFSGARVIKVSAGGGSISGSGDADALSGKKKEANVDKDQLKDLQKLSPEEYQKKAQKLPDTTKLPGKAPKKDKKDPGGGSGGGEVIE